MQTEDHQTPKLRLGLILFYSLLWITSTTQATQHHHQKTSSSKTEGIVGGSIIGGSIVAGVIGDQTSKHIASQAREKTSKKPIS